MKRIIYIVQLMLIGWIQGFAQSSNQNYLISRTYNYNTTNGTDSVVQIQYFDGLGRPIETVQKGITPTGKDLVTLTEYDGAGREQYQWLPKTNAGSGAFVTPDAFKSISEPLYSSDSRPFSEIVYESSPLNRVLQQKGVGADWINKPVTTAYETNAGEVKYFYVNASGQLVSNGTYAPATLYKTVTKDEDGKQTIEYKDKLGRTVMQRRGTTDFADTYYVYNDLGQLAYVLPPLAADANGAADAVNKYGYVYQYDDRGNCIYKKLPGCMPIYMVYDKADRLILSQDGNQRLKNQWTITKYDVFGRVVFTGVMTSTTTQSTFATTLKGVVATETFNGSTVLFNSGYSNTTYTGFAAVNNLLTVNYYDDYRFIKTLPAAGIDTTKIIYSAKQGYSAQYTPPSGGKGAAGLLTGTRTYLLDGSGKYTVTAMYYDDKGRVVQTRSTNHMGGYDIVYNDLDFTGKPNKMLKEHNIAVNGVQQPVISELYTYTYDHAGRNTKTVYQFKNQTPVTLTDMTASGAYDELGRLKTKKRHNGADTETFAYNIRNWTTQINSGNSLIENLYYNQNLPTGTAACYNGNIAAQTWTYGSPTANKGYAYQYDEHNRLLNAVFQQGTGTQAAGSFDENFTYDRMGNVRTLKRKKDNVLIDNLTLEYNGNQLKYINDPQGSQNLSTVKEYQNKSNTTAEFTYDVNGNLTKDLDRDIVTIRYNLLNLPDTVQFKNGNQIINKYDAGGQKLSVDYLTLNTPLAIPLAEGQVNKWTYNSSLMTVTGTVYDGTYEYNSAINSSGAKSFTLNKVYNPEGYIRTTDNAYMYYRRDHLGNNREVWLAQANANIQRTQYYPSGLPWAESTGASIQNRKYNGKEWIEAHGLDEYDSQARMYYPAIMRTTTMDPLAEKYYSISPYAWCGNNPVRIIDPDGMWITIYDGMSSYQYDNGQLYQENWITNRDGNKVLQLDKYTPTKGSFLEGTLNALNTISNSGKAGKDLISFFANDNNTAEIHSTSKGNSIDMDKNSGNPIYMNKDLKGSENIPTTSGLQKSDFWVDLSHELGHRQDFINNPKTSMSDWFMMHNGQVLLNTEKYATHIENLIRFDSGLSLRTHYATEELYLSNQKVIIPYEPTRIIDLINGKYVNKYYNYTYKK